jgi:hypothetical protein
MATNVDAFTCSDPIQKQRLLTYVCTTDHLNHYQRHLTSNTIKDGDSKFYNTGYALQSYAFIVHARLVCTCCTPKDKKKGFNSQLLTACNHPHSGFLLGSPYEYRGDKIQKMPY